MRKRLVTDVFSMKTEKQFFNTLEDKKHRQGAMDKLFSDQEQVEISKRVLDILRSFCIDDWQSEPHYQHQKYAERRYSVIKSLVNILLNMTEEQASSWTLALEYDCYILNHLDTESLGWITPLKKLTRSTPDISSILLFKFWEKVYYKAVDPSFPSD